jgi:xylan 1,4-beta-xylosidase
MGKEVRFTVDAKQVTGRLDHSWRWIGYDECNYTYIPEGLELLSKFSALEEEPYYARTHFMFCTGNCHGTYKFGSTNLYTEDEAGNPVYCFDTYDMVIDAYLKTGIKPFLELGFMPQDLMDTAYAPNLQNIHRRYEHYRNTGWTCPPKSYPKWHSLIEALTEHLVQKYGADEVKTWYFELWNEPDIFYWSGTAAEYCKLFDYTEHAMHRILPEAYLSGPAVTGMHGGKYALAFFEDFLEHCKSGVNFCTGETGTRLDYVTFHAKGGGFPFQLNAPKQVPTLEKLLGEIRTGLEAMRRHGFAGKELVISEADPDGWAAGGAYDNPNLNFRNTEYYASYVAAAYYHIEKMSEEFGMPIRPLAWAFFFPGERMFEGTRTFSTQGVNKAVFNLFKLYGRLGHQKLACTGGGEYLDGSLNFDRQPNLSVFNGDAGKADISAFAVRGGGWEAQIVVFSHHNDWDIREESRITLTVRGYGEEKGLPLRHYRIDGSHSNAYAQWVAEGKPIYPAPGQYAAIKARDGLEKLEPDTVADSVGDAITLSFRMPAHGVSLITIGYTAYRDN